MTCMCCGHAEIFHGPTCTGGESSSKPCRCPGYEAIPAAAKTLRAKMTANINTGALLTAAMVAYDLDGNVIKEATWVEGREAPKPCESFRDARAGAPGSTSFCDVHIADPGCHHCGAPRSAHGPDLEACARAGYEARYADSLHLRRPWAEQDESTRALWREIARAVLAAAGVGR